MNLPPNKNLRVAVVIPVFNEASHIANCLEALAAQTFTPHNIYIVDNNSTDETVAIVKKYPKITLLGESTQGICASTLNGLSAASEQNDLILRLDADCRPTREWIEKMVQACVDDSSIDAVTGPGIAYDTGPVRTALINIFYMKPYFTLIHLALGQRPLFGSNFIIRSSAWKKIHTSTHLATHQNIHDDIDISYHLKGTILYRDDIKMPISARPFHSIRSMFHRYVAGFRSVFIHWPEQAPWKNRF